MTYGIQIKLGTHVIGLFPITHAKQAILHLAKMMKNDIKIQVMYDSNSGSLESEDVIEMYTKPIGEYAIRNWNCLMRHINKNNESEEATITNRQMVDIIYAFNEILRKDILIPNQVTGNFASIKIFDDVSNFINDLDEDFPGIKYFNESVVNITGIKITDLFIGENNEETNQKEKRKT